jgi:hypothetical protein
VCLVGITTPNFGLQILESWRSQGLGEEIRSIVRSIDLDELKSVMFDPVDYAIPISLEIFRLGRLLSI